MKKRNVKSFRTTMAIGLSLSGVLRELDKEVNTFLLSENMFLISCQDIIYTEKSRERLVRTIIFEFED